MVLSATADAAVLRAPGDPTEAVVWEEVKARIEQDSRLTPTWLILMVVAVLIAGIGIITDSAVLIVGAMVVGPEYGPVASVAVGLHLNTWSWVRRGLLDLAVGFGVAVPAAGAMAWLLHQADRLPDDFANGSNVATAFISRPDLFSVLVAALAGVAGTLSLTLARSGTLVGVLISVTTVPAAAGIGAYAAEGRYEDAAGSLAQLLLNLILLAAVGALTLRVQRRVHLAHTRRTPAPIRPRAGARDPRDRRRS